jgi:MHS family proline/betaine transporter-like MFS transporter
MSTDSGTATSGGLAKPVPHAGVSRLILATSIGNALEFYDLIVYGYFATTLSRLFFPVHDRTISLLLTLGTFALSYLARPVGALVLGSFSDRKGRKTSLTLSIAMMTLGTGMVALMPTYASIGLRRSAFSLRACCRAFRPAANSAVQLRF